MAQRTGLTSEGVTGRRLRVDLLYGLSLVLLFAVVIAALALSRPERPEVAPVGSQTAADRMTWQDCPSGLLSRGQFEHMDDPSDPAQAASAATAMFERLGMSQRNPDSRLRPVVMGPDKQVFEVLDPDGARVGALVLLRGSHGWYVDSKMECVR